MAKRGRKKSSGGGGRRFGFRLNMNALLAGGLAGAVGPYSAKFLGPTIGPAVGLIGVGAFMGNETLQTLGGLSLGSRLIGAASLPGAPVGGGGVVI